MKCSGMHARGKQLNCALRCGVMSEVDEKERTWRGRREQVGESKQARASERAQAGERKQASASRCEQGKATVSVSGGVDMRQEG